MDHSGHDHSGHSAVLGTTEDPHAGHDMSGHAGHDMSGHAGHDMSGHTGGGAQTHDMMMAMFFHFGYNETILFSWWKISTIGGLIGSMIGIFVLAMLYEGLKYGREALFRRALAASQYSANLENKNSNNLNADNKAIQYMEQILMPPPMSMMSGGHLLQTFLHMLQFVISYFLMLIFMTYNVWLCLACMLGAGTGYFLFGWRKSVVVDVTEHCH
ncbi:unnamed protein product [Meganyctiphanes norvegica]|uniref:Copper transport protein n=1 Tax=Meganyctiphanes norvegica TaxID=48144 RepID=A0AAV2S8W7_MEGNR